MKKNELIQSIKIIIIGLIVVIGINFAYAKIIPQFYQPSGAPSANINAKSAIISGAVSSPQSREGALILGPDVAPGGVWGYDLTTNGFVDTKGISNEGNSLFLGNVLVGSTANPLPSITVKSLSGTGERNVCSDATGKLAICNAGSCGTANGQTLNSIPTTQAQLCSTGTASAVSGSGPWNWTCSSSGGSVSCNAAKTIVIPPPATATCGSANGTTLSLAQLQSGTNVRCGVGSSFANGSYTFDSVDTDKLSWTCVNQTNGQENNSCYAHIVNICGPASNIDYYYATGSVPSPQADGMCAHGLSGEAGFPGTSLQSHTTTSEYNVNGQYIFIKYYTWNCGALSCKSKTPW